MLKERTNDQSDSVRLYIPSDLLQNVAVIPSNESRTAPYLTNLNPPQLEAVQHFTGPILVLAGAGSGKTRVLTHRVANLILTHGVRPSSILAVTFTNKAAEEMKNRLHSLLGPAGRGLWISTFHSAALRILRHHAKLLAYTNDFVVYDEQDTKSVLKQVVKELNIDDKKFPPQMFARFIDQCKNALVTPEAAHKNAKDFGARQQADVYERYQRELMKANAMDFGDLLMNAVLIFKRFPDILELYRSYIHFVLVDEFQDTNAVQYEFVRLMAEPRRNLLVVGDDDQSIYAFRGATIRNILEFERDFPETKVIKLEQNYRSSAHILSAAHAVIEKNKSRKKKKLWTDRGEGAPITAYLAETESEEASFLVRQIQTRFRSGTPYSQIAVFYRTNAQSRAIEEALVSSGIPYRIYGGLKFYDRKEIKDILGYLRLIVNEQDNQAFARTLNTPPRGIGAQTFQNIVDEANGAGIPYLHAARKIGERNKHVAAYLALMTQFTQAAASMSLSELIQDVITKTEYGPKLKALKDPTSESRLENLQELVAIGASMQASAETPLEVLRQFLDRVSLTSSADLPEEKENQNPNSAEAKKPEAVSLMTLHLAKGLEFPVVFLTGVEEGLMPHHRSINDPVAIEEERRLCYVGITRAMEQLYITRARQRGMFSAGDGFGVSGMLREVSRFIKDIPPEHIDSLGDDFIATSMPRYEPVEEDEYVPQFGRSRDQYNGPGKSRYSVSAGKAMAFSAGQVKKPLLKTADQLSEKTHRDWSADLATVEIGQLSEGLNIIHPTFGRGTIESVEGDIENNPGKVKVGIRFAESNEPRKLVFKYAKLSLPR
ncbi:MAG: UvrD-helicase domain-containing protein [Deltaproteobacteria bacterium]|nr:UvrD-helicase domain-containing protein [Deltaproteobacteria bacterium]